MGFFDKIIGKNDVDFQRKGLDLIEQQNYVGSIQAFNLAIEKNPEDYLSWNGKGIALYELEKNDEALYAINQSIQINPTYLISWIYKAKLHGFLLQYEEALRAFDQVIKIDPLYPHAMVIKGELARLAAIKLKRNDLFEEALSAYNRVNKDDNYDFRAYYGKMQALKALNRNNEAEQILVQFKTLPNYEVILAISDMLEDTWQSDNDFEVDAYLVAQVIQNIK